MSYMEKYEKDVEGFVRVCHTLSDNKYVTSHGGNLAWKLEENLLLITPTRMNKGDIAPQDCVFIDLSGKKVEGMRSPTGETPMYLNFFRERPEIQSVIHSHPPNTTAFAVLQGTNWLMRPVFPETVAEVGPVPIVPYAEPLTQRLADNFLPYLKRYNAFLMESHGLVILSPRDIHWTLMLTELLEMSAVSLLQALRVGRIRELSPEDVKALENTMKTRALPLFGTPGVNKSLVDLYFSE